MSTKNKDDESCPVASAIAAALAIGEAIAEAVDSALHGADSDSLSTGHRGVKKLKGGSGQIWGTGATGSRKRLVVNGSSANDRGQAH